ncbi:MAG: DNA-directed RNA polymerase subunit F [Candidatus Diapherotrites archaeon]|nr:DNA-directed RNA polymerase subunit F [Candidatus Diapherotrites archaeon]
MIGKEVIDEREITLSEAKALLQKRKREAELSYEQKLAYEHVSEFGKLAPTKAAELVEELKKIGKIDEHIAVMIVDNMPMDKDDLRVIMEKKRYKLSDDDIKKVLSLVDKYRK